MFVTTIAATLVTVASSAVRHWHHAVASFYGGELGWCGNGLHRLGAHTFASRSVPCGMRIRFCWHRRCVWGRRADTGPYVPGRRFDLSTQMAERLHMTTAGVVTIRWRRLP